MKGGKGASQRQTPDQIVDNIRKALKGAVVSCYAQAKKDHPDFLTPIKALAVSLMNIAGKSTKEKSPLDKAWKAMLTDSTVAKEVITTAKKTA